MGDNLFTGLDEIDWAGMQHAYGRAVDVPGLLRRLIDPDPAVRERALDYMYGVHPTDFGIAESRQLSGVHRRWRQPPQ